MLELALEKSINKHIENDTETPEHILVRVLLRIVTENANYSVKDIRDKMDLEYDESPNWLTTNRIGKALRRLGFAMKHRVSTGYEYYLTKSDVADQAERMEVKDDSATMINFV